MATSATLRSSTINLAARRMSFLDLSFFFFFLGEAHECCSTVIYVGQILPGICPMGRTGELVLRLLDCRDVNQPSLALPLGVSVFHW